MSADAAAICAIVGSFVITVGLFVDTGVYRTLRQVPLHVSQFHGRETADDLLALVVANFRKRTNGRPRTEKNLRSSVKTLIGVQYSDKELATVLVRLQKTGTVTIFASKLVYQLENDQ